MRIGRVRGETEHVSFGGKRMRRPTVLIKVGNHGMSERAFLLGSTLVLFQILDGLLTFLGLTAYGVDMEGNTLLRKLIEQYGLLPTLVMVKFVAVSLVVLLTVFAHRRRWVRPLILSLSVIYLTAAVGPWMLILK